MGSRDSRTRRLARRSGWVLTEAMASVLLLGTLLGTFLTLQVPAGRANHYQLTTQRCIAAAEATLQCVTATGQPLPDEDVRRLWPSVRVEVRRRPAEGDWAGLTLVTAVARSDSRGRDVAVTLRRYVAPSTARETRP